MIRFTVFTDLHFDGDNDRVRRLDEIANHIKCVNPDFAISLGDLCSPEDNNKERVLNKLNTLGIPVYYAIGNHESDTYKLNDILNFYGMSKPYYSFQTEQVKFIVLDSNYTIYDGVDVRYGKHKNGLGERRYPIIPEDEVLWIKNEISDGKKYVIFSHHSLVNEFRDRGIKNRKEIRDLFHGKDILLCMNGHDHGDDYQNVDGVPYYCVNSATYIWCGCEPDGVLYYKNAMWVDVEIDENEIRIIGVDNDYLSVTPEEVGITDYHWNGVSVEAKTSSRVISQE